MNICCLKANRHYNLQFCSENKLLLLLHTLNVTSGFGAEKNGGYPLPYSFISHKLSGITPGNITTKCCETN